jgi:hypothetical protein
MASSTRATAVLQIASSRTRPKLFDRSLFGNAATVADTRPAGLLDGLPLETHAPRALLTVPVASSLSFPGYQVFLVDAEAVAFAGGPEWSVAKHVTLPEESKTPVPIGTASVPATVAAPTRRLFQTKTAAAKAVHTISWTPLRSHPIQVLTAVAR